MPLNYLIIGGGVLALLSSVFTGIFCGSIYCTAPDVFSYASGQAVRKELLSLPRSTVTLLGSSSYLSVLGLWAAGPSLATVAGLPLYAMIIILFVAGFAFASYDHQVPLPEMVTGPFLVVAMVHSFPDLAAVGSSAVAIGIVLVIRSALGLSILAFLTLSGDACRPRLYGIITDDTWLFLAGAAAWIGMRHVVGLFMCLVPVIIVAILWQRITVAGAANKALLDAQNPYLRLSRQPIVIPWGALITIALLLEMTLRPESVGGPLRDILIPFFANLI